MKQKIIEYLMTTPNNTNINVLESLLSGVENKEEIIKYALNTPNNMNINMLNSLIKEKSIVGIAKVGEAKAA